MRILSVSRPGKSAFTLIELLVVIAIIAILAAIMFPVFLSAKAAAKLATCKSNLRQIHTATTMYLDDWQGQMFANVSFPGVWGNDGGGAYTRQGLRGWIETLWRYHHKVEIYRCPTYYANYSYALNGMCESRRAPRRPSKTVTYFDAPGSGNSRAASNKGVIFPFGVNDVLSGDSNLQCGNADGSAGGQVEGDCRRPDEYRSYAWMPRSDTEIATFNAPRYTNCRFLLFPGPHNGANNILFWDGHVRTVMEWKPGAMTMWLR
jgi:prepilin-type N-terminal cleavage/methylation domain-containing protein/prepilin-type processing-associated H-X9-DG protein